MFCGEQKAQVKGPLHEKGLDAEVIVYLQLAVTECL
jgi:hypothetical protein